MNPKSEQPIILVVDDLIDNILLLDNLLKGQYQVKVANSGEKALKIAGSNPKPDLILLDIMMPEMDGFEVCRRLKTDPGLAEIPVIFITGKNATSDEVTGLELGAVDFIAKPINPPVVLARIRTQLIAKQARDLLRQKNELFESSLHAAASIQESLLPKVKALGEHLTFGWKFQPCELVGGDIFSYFQLDENHIGMYIVDVTGHGLPAAMITLAITQMLQPLSETLMDLPSAPPKILLPSQVMKKLNAAFPFDRFNSCFTIAYVVFDVENKKLLSCAAGHPRPILLKSDGTLVTLDEGGLLIGFSNQSYEDRSVSINPGDKVVLFSDGIDELFNSKREMFGMDRLEDLLRQNSKESIDTIIQRVDEALRAFSEGSPPGDDITVVGFEYLGKE